MVKRGFNTNTENNDEWLTPPEVTAALGDFDLDPCQPVNPPFTHAKKGYNILDDGLTKKWEGRIWCNPPYGKETFIWLEKLATHNNGIALIFARTETVGFHAQIWEKADGIFFFLGRLKFYRIDGTQAKKPNAPSCLVAYGQNNVEYLRKALKEGLIRGKLVVPDNNRNYYE